MEVEELTMALGPLNGSEKLENGISTGNSSNNNGTNLGNGNLLKKQYNFPASDSSTGVDNDFIATSELLSSDTCNRAQFWGAVGIFIEKPHILNRRLYGVADLWWGKLSLPLTDSQIKEADATGGQAIGQDQSGLDKCSNDNECSVAETHEAVSMTSVASCTVGNMDNLLLMAWDLMQDSKNESNEVCEEKTQGIDTDNTVQEGCIVNMRGSVDEEKLVADLKTLLRNSAFEDIPMIEGSRFEPWPELTGGSNAIYAVVRRALPKQTLRFNTCFELVLLDGRHGRCSVASSFSRPPLLPARPYHLQHQLEDGRLMMVWLGGNNSSSSRKKEPYCGSVGSPASDVPPLNDRELSPPPISSGLHWLQEVVLPRVARWASQVSEEGATGNNGSLTNVDLQAYSALYGSLKSKYAEKLVKSWTERTDPHKFVHEDIGIATYLLLLWAKLPRPQRFLDLGCGNGLLVYILASEGHLGQGLDIRKRAIWDTFPPFVDLQEHVVRPHDGCLPSDADWLLGNHSDELTPWIPVMAARASHTCSFFVLPCCPHDFTAKFLRRNSSMSQYADYLNYVQEVGEQSGFVMERDRLRIPSTKRVCFVGRTRNYSLEERSAVLERLQQFIDKRVAHYVNNQPVRKEAAAEDTQEVHGESDFATSVTNGVAKELLQSVSLNGSPTSALSQTILNGDNKNLGTNELFKSIALETGMPGSGAASVGGGKMWSAGFVARGREQRTRNCTQLHQDVKDDLVGAVVKVILGSEPPEACLPWQAGASTPLRQVADALGPRRLQLLKKECGGLQTLLRNHRHIFAVQQGTVMLRPPGKLPEDLKRHRQCWFYLHHPQGCPNSATSCIYDHMASGTASAPAAAKVVAQSCM